MFIKKNWGTKKKENRITQNCQDSRTFHLVLYTQYNPTQFPRKSFNRTGKIVYIQATFMIVWSWNSKETCRTAVIWSKAHYKLENQGQSKDLTSRFIKSFIWQKRGAFSSLLLLSKDSLCKNGTWINEHPHFFNMMTNWHSLKITENDQSPL